MTTNAGKYLMIAFFLFGLIFFSQSIWIQAKASTAQLLIERSWQATLSAPNSTEHETPWPWADTWPVARLVFPQHGKELFALAGSNGTSLAFGPGHLDGSALPEEAGTKVFSAHRDTHFHFFSDIDHGDQVLMQSRDGKWQHLHITNTRIVDTEKEKWLLNLDSEKVLLITCYPFDAVDTGGPLRFVATAEPIKIPSKINEKHKISDRRSLSPLTYHF